ncbi:hypothetical protein LTR85_006639 [Meristemomyces frigidus]|nr:hypothetical protein LTR85_006639 [Meristemomyces frigidus]
MASPNPKVGFLNLPPELRNGIYELATEADSEAQPTMLWQYAITHHLALSQVNRQLLDGSAPTIASFRKYIEAADADTISAIQSLGIFFPCGTAEAFHEGVGTPHTVLLTFSRTAWPDGPFEAELQHVDILRHYADPDAAATSKRTHFMKLLLSQETPARGAPYHRDGFRSGCSGRSDLSLLAMRVNILVAQWTRPSVEECELLALCDLISDTGDKRRADTERKMAEYFRA